MRILVVEDEPLLADAVADALRRATHAVDVAYDGGAALERAAVFEYDVVVLDRDLPVVHGDEVCRRLAAEGSEARVIMLTAAARVDDRVDGLALGADDYFVKPVDRTRLLERLREITAGTLLLATETVAETPGRRDTLVIAPGPQEHPNAEPARGPDEGYGPWYWGISPSALRTMLALAGFAVDEEHRTPFHVTVVAH
jgi:DNA-binding response OmpR family regulator